MSVALLHIRNINLPREGSFTRKHTVCPRCWWPSLRARPKRS